MDSPAVDLSEVNLQDLGRYATLKLSRWHGNVTPFKTFKSSVQRCFKTTKDIQYVQIGSQKTKHAHHKVPSVANTEQKLDIALSSHVQDLERLYLWVN